MQRAIFYDRTKQAVLANSTCNFIELLCQIKEFSGSDIYVFVFDPKKYVEYAGLLQEIGQMVLDQDLEFSWHDAAIVAYAVRRMRQRALNKLHSA